MTKILRRITVMSLPNVDIKLFFCEVFFGWGVKDKETCTSFSVAASKGQRDSSGPTRHMPKMSEQADR